MSNPIERINPEFKKELEDNHTFFSEVIEGLTSHPKFLLSKYLYDAKGDELFQQIMGLEEYYITDCELEVFEDECKQISDLLKRFDDGFDVIELGCGDAYKSKRLLKCLLNEHCKFTYYPTDISANVVELVEQKLPAELPELKIKGLVGEYFTALEEATKISSKPKIVLFLGSNIGNMPLEESKEFCSNLRRYLNAKDLVLIGFDLQKNPWTIFKAYNDKEGITKRFNLNLLERINRELKGNFDLNEFEHYESYEPETGACKSYLFSLKKQKVKILDVEIEFEENEYIFMEMSQKFTLEQIHAMASFSGYNPLLNLFDRRKYFTDAIWEAN